MAQDRVSLTVPARSDYARTVRMTASALVSRIGMSYDEVEDVRMAAEEAFIYAVDTMPEGANVTFEFLVDENGLAINVMLGSRMDIDSAEVDKRTSYAEFILQSVCDAYDMESAADGQMCLHLEKQVKRVDGD